MAKPLDIKQMEAWIRAGQFELVEGALKRLNVKKVGREHALAVANIARRVNMFTVALNILNPIVRPQHPLSAPATPLEQIEYAEVLRKVGAINEAREILEQVNEHDFPQTLLFRALCHFSHWRYQDAIPLLKSYVNSKGISGYTALVGQLNLAAALVHEKLIDEAQATLAHLRQETRAAGYSLLLGHSLELSAQLEIGQSNWREAAKFLDEATDCLANTGSVGQLWLKKWRAINNSLESQTVTLELLETLDLAVKSSQWETVRDCSFYIARIRRDRALMDKIFFGTPHESYRKNILAVTREWYQPFSGYIYSGDSSQPARVLDVPSGQMHDGTEVMAIGQVHHRLLILLSRDLFKPLPLVAAFALLFPEEHFNPLSAPTRIHQAVRRLRASLKKHKLSLEVREANGSYYLQPAVNEGLRLPKDPVPEDSRELQLRVLLGSLPLEFSIRDVTRTMGGSLSKGQRLLRWAIAENKLNVISAGPRTRYRAAA